MKQLHQVELHKLNTSLAAKKSEIETANSRLGQLSSEIEVAKSANLDLKTNMERLKASHKEEQMKVESLTKELHHSKDTVKKVTSDLDSAKERFEAFKGHARSCHFRNLILSSMERNIRVASSKYRGNTFLLSIPKTYNCKTWLRVNKQNQVLQTTSREV